VTAILSRKSDQKYPARKEYRNINLFAGRMTLNGVEHGCYKVPLVASDAAAGVFSLRNRENGRIIVTKVIVDVTTKATGACTLDIGMAATEILSDTLIDGLDVGTAVGVFDSVKEAGTNGVSSQSVAQGAYVTASKASGAAAGLVGNAYIYWIKP
jgi:hypothetical protein